ncbi:hypothetical protein VTK56DRAFT_7586 [Thermocarpiscus australiensis]
MLTETFTSWLNSITSCCSSREKPRQGIERSIVVLRDQPAVNPRPSAEPLWSNRRTYDKRLEQERERTRLRRTVGRDSSSVRKHWFSRSTSSSRRWKISGPTDFRHVHSESLPFALPTRRERPLSFRPIELSIYQPHNRLSPILPHLTCDDDIITAPPRVYTANSSRWDGSSGTTLTNERSYSTMSFHIPRRHGRQESSISDASMSPPRIPPKSRARAYTAPNPEKIVERIASALVEKERLQAEINSIIERQSIYMSSRPNSRPSTGYDMRGLEPMPSIPALPAAAPSFAERLSVDGRPRTAPSRTSHVTVQEKTLELAAAAHTPQTPDSGSAEKEDEPSLDRPLAPPLPLILRPPLRKKKSFSRVSNWLFHPGDRPEAGGGGDSAADDSSPTTYGYVTTSPRPVKASDGFYQCVAPPEGLPRTSMETSSSVYTWETGEDEEEAKTVATTTAWSSPRAKQSKQTTPVVAGAEMDGDGDGDGKLGVGNADANGHRPLSVGVAF